MDTNRSTVVDCSDLFAFQSFEEYISTLRNTTSFDESLLDKCRSSICGALWGYGVPDISGIGVAVGYLLATILGPLLSVLLLLTLSSSTSHFYVLVTKAIINLIPRRVVKHLPSQSKLQSIFASGLVAFFESAIYFALAIEIATIAILAPKDYESQVVAFGDYDARTCSLVSTICLLPLLYPVVVLSFLSSPDDNLDGTTDAPPPVVTASLRIVDASPKPEQDAHDQPNSTPASPNTNSNSNSPTTPSTPQNNSEITRFITHRAPHRLTLFSICTLLSIYPFLSQSFRTWAPSQVGTGKGPDGKTIVNETEWDSLSGICFTSGGSNGGVNTLSVTEHVVLGVFQTVASCIVLFFGIAVCLPRGLKVLEWHLSFDTRTGSISSFVEGRDGEPGASSSDRPTNGNDNNMGVTTSNSNMEGGIHGSDTGSRALRVTKGMIRLCDAVKRKCQYSALVRTFLLALPVSLAAPLLWGFWRLRGLQGELATATGGRDEGGEWSFGQVVAITIFLPVGAEMIFMAVCGDGGAHG